MDSLGTSPMHSPPCPSTIQLQGTKGEVVKFDCQALPGHDGEHEWVQNTPQGGYRVQWWTYADDG